MPNTTAINILYLIIGIFAGVVGSVVFLYLIQNRQVTSNTVQEKEEYGEQKYIERLSGIETAIKNMELTLNKVGDSHPFHKQNLPSEHFGKEERLLQLAIERRILEFETENAHRLIHNILNEIGVESHGRHLYLLQSIYDILVEFGDRSQQLVHLFFTKLDKYQEFHHIASTLGPQLEQDVWNELMGRTISEPVYSQDYSKGHGLLEDMHTRQTAETLWEFVRIPLMNPYTLVEAKSKINEFLQKRNL